MSVIDKLQTYANHNLNVLFIGRHGIGKTTMAKQVAENLDLNFKYYSSPTLDPWVDVVGVPKPNDETGDLDFYVPKEMRKAEMLFFDELSRAHPRVLNAVLEIIQFKSVNGQPFPNLKMVWAAINPAGEDYNVEELDPALLDRFHVYIRLDAEFSMDYMKTKMKEKTAKILRAWWNEDMDKNQRNLITPRRLEYIGFMIDNQIEWKEALPTGTFPDGMLRKRLEEGNSKNLNITKESVLSDVEYYDKLAKNDPSSCIKLAEVIRMFGPEDCFKIRNILESMPKDLVRSLAEVKWPFFKRTLVEHFKNNKLDVRDFPKIFELFGLEEYAGHTDK